MSKILRKPRAYSRLILFVSVVTTLALTPVLVVANPWVNCPCAGIYEGWGECPATDCGYDADESENGECGLSPGECCIVWWEPLFGWHHTCWDGECDSYYPHLWCDEKPN
jgi:hypothetical protein